MNPHRLKPFLLGTLTAGLLAGAPLHAADPAPAAPPPFYFEPAKVAAWWYMGETVKFRIGGATLPQDVTSVEGVIRDIGENEIARIKLTRAEFDASGWTWQPTAPGYYEVEFFSSKADAGPVPVRRSNFVKAAPAALRDFPRSKQGFAVLPSKEAPVAAVGQFGFDYSNNSDELILARLVGFDLVRLLCDWGADFTNLNKGIESVKGTYNWPIFDKKVELFSNAGFVLNAQFNYTPVWASPHPEKTNVNICVVESTSYAPVDMGDFSRFVEAAVTRYKDKIHLWEIWNEPSVPGGSVYWSDTPENFVKLLQAGFEAVKKVQPDAQVWIGGLGPRQPYHVFYNRILKLGAGKYFDALSLHGSWNTPAETFRSIEINNGVAPKPAVSGEWHAILQGNMQSEPLLSESALSFKMMKDLLYQLKQGIERVFFFELKNQTEKESLDFARENKFFTHSSGLFRTRPQVEPRQAAVVMANFIALTGHKATYVKEFKLSNDAVALQFTTAKGPLVVFWSEGAALQPQSVEPFSTPDSQLIDWEGKPLSSSQGAPLAGKRLYYLTNANTKAVALAENANKLISPRLLTRASQTANKGVYFNGKLFPSVQAAPAVPDAAWLDKDWKLTQLVPAGHDKTFSARAAVGAHEEGLDIVVEVQDAELVQKEPQPAWWNGDSIQIALDCEGAGLPGDNTEIVAALTDQGAQAWKLSAANPRGDIPARWSSANGPVKFAEKNIARDGSTTRYQLRIPWSELYPLTYDASKPIRLSLAVNNNNGAGRAEYTEWGGGITKDKDPSAYGLLQPLPAR